MYGFGAIKKPTDSRFENQSAMYQFMLEDFIYITF